MVPSLLLSPSPLLSALFVVFFFGSPCTQLTHLDPTSDLSRMRRFPARPSQSSENRPNSPPSAQLHDWHQAPSASATLPAFSYSSIAASNVRSQNGTPGPTSSFDLSASDGGSGGHSISTGGFSTDSLNPFKYSKELMLSLYRPTGLPIEFERHEYMTSEDSLPPMSSQPFSEQELKVSETLSTITLLAMSSLLFFFLSPPFHFWRERERERERASFYILPYWTNK